MAQYTSAEILLFIAAVGAVLVNVILAWKTNKTAQDTLTKAAIIEGHVNSKETKYVEQIASLARENDILRKVIIDNEKVAALLAQSVATKTPTTSEAKESKVLESIKTNTGNIDKNTKNL